jgi:hypothetical protein
MNPESVVSVDLTTDDGLIARIEMYPQQHGMTVEALVLQSVAAFLKAPDAGGS